MNAIYEPKGKAFEYSPLAANLYSGCGHRCTYCYAPDVVRRTHEDFCANPKPRKGILAQLRKDAEKMAGDPRPVLFSFTSDPYQLAEAEHEITRQALEILGENNMKAKVLTKNGTLAMRDLDLFMKYDVAFGTTMLFFDDKSRQEWEPNAASVSERIGAIMLAAENGVKTWVSIEPVIDPHQALKLIDVLHPYVDLWKVGKLNHDPEREAQVNWTTFLHKVLTSMEKYKATYYIKNALWEFATPAIKERHAKENE